MDHKAIRLMFPMLTVGYVPPTYTHTHILTLSTLESLEVMNNREGEEPRVRPLRRQIINQLLGSSREASLCWTGTMLKTSKRREV